MKVFKHTQKLMGTIFTLGIKHSEEEVARTWLREGIEEIVRVEHLLSEFLPNSDIGRINQSDRQWIEVSSLTFDLLQRSLDISKMTGGAFDISVGPLKSIYDFRKEIFKMPKSKHINKALNNVGYQKIQLDKDNLSVRLSESDMRLSFAAIGKGFVADHLIKLWKSKGVTDAFVNASGDIKAIGTNQKEKAWVAGIANPDHYDKILFEIKLDGHNAVATSGDSEQHFWHNDVRYSHNIDPITGYPLVGLKSISVISPSAELSDALSTAIYVKGVKKGIDFVNFLPNTHVILIDQEQKVFLSKKIHYEEILPHTNTYDADRTE